MISQFEEFAGLEMFVCGMYGKYMWHMNNLDDVRYAYFQQHYAPKKGITIGENQKYQPL